LKAALVKTRIPQTRVISDASNAAVSKHHQCSSAGGYRPTSGVCPNGRKYYKIWQSSRCNNTLNTSLQY